MEAISISVTILLKLNIADLMGLLYLLQMIGVSELLKLFGIDEITKLSLKMLCKSIKLHTFVNEWNFDKTLFMVDLRINIRTSK